MTITLHNTLGEATSLYLGGQALVPDTVGAAAGGTATYTFTASRPGTYLYEAGLTTNHQHQVAMGLYGALVVHSATAGEAYDAPRRLRHRAGPGPRRDRPGTQHLRPTPAHFDMRDFAPRSRSSTARSHPSTDADRRPAPGRTSCCAGSTPAPCTTRWRSSGPTSGSSASTATGSPRPAADISRRVGRRDLRAGADRRRDRHRPDDRADRRLAVYDASLTLHNTNAAGAGGMLTFLDVTGAGGARPTPPARRRRTRATSTADGTIAATVSDAATGGGNVAAAECASTRRTRPPSR